MRIACCCPCRSAPSSRWGFLVARRRPNRALSFAARPQCSLAMRMAAAAASYCALNARDVNSFFRSASTRNSGGISRMRWQERLKSFIPQSPQALAPDPARVALPSCSWAAHSSTKEAWSRLPYSNGCANTWNRHSTQPSCRLARRTSRIAARHCILISSRPPTGADISNVLPTQTYFFANPL